MTTHKIIERSWKSGNERADNEFFWNRFGFLDSEVFIQNTDGIIQGSLFEFKNSISDLNNVLIQAIKYLSQVRHLGGIPVPTKIILVDINKDYCYVYDATKYKNLIENKYTDSASKNNDKLTVKDSTAPEAEFKHVDKYLLDKDKQKEVEKEEQKQDKQKEKEKRKGKMV